MMIMWKLIKRSNSIQFLHSLPKPFQHSVWFSVWFSVLSACIFSLYHPWCVFATRILDCRNSRVHSWHSPHSTQLIHLISQLSIKLQVTALNLARPVGARILYLKSLATSPIFRTDCFWQMARQMGLSENRVPHKYNELFWFPYCWTCHFGVSWHPLFLEKTVIRKWKTPNTSMESSLNSSCSQETLDKSTRWPYTVEPEAT